MTDAEAVVAAQVDAYNAQDIDRFIAMFHPDCEFIRWPDVVAFRGHAAFRERYAALWARAPDLSARIVTRMTSGRFVVDLEQLVGHPDGDRPPIIVTYEIEANLIRRFWVIGPDS